MDHQFSEDFFHAYSSGLVARAPCSAIVIYNMRCVDGRETTYRLRTSIFKRHAFDNDSDRSLNKRKNPSPRTQSVSPKPSQTKNPFLFAKNLQTHIPLPLLRHSNRSFPLPSSNTPTSNSNSTSSSPSNRSSSSSRWWRWRIISGCVGIDGCVCCIVCCGLRLRVGMGRYMLV